MQTEMQPLASITLKIPHELCKDFLGIMALDVLHDAKGHGYLAGHRLSQLTDLIAQSIILHGDLQAHTEEIREYVFKQVLSYFIELWGENLKALGLDSSVSIDLDDPTLRQIVQLPLHNVAGREDDDTFTSLGGGRQGIEAENYFYQRSKLTGEHVESMAFISPKGITKPSDYFHQASGIVDIIMHRTDGKSKIVLDMKSSAGLIRTITDPIGYTTGLPTYADPGYNMPGMSAIRQHAQVEFVGSATRSGKTYGGPQEFSYSVQLDTGLLDTPLTLLNVRYFYGIAKDGLDRGNVMVGILDELFQGTLPRSFVMADALGQYLLPTPREEAVQVRDVLNIVENAIWHYYQDICPELQEMQALHRLYVNIHNGAQCGWGVSMMDLGFDAHLADQLFDSWCGANSDSTNVLNASYLIGTLRNMYLTEARLGADPACLLPIEMITNTLPELIANNTSLPTLAFCYQQLKLLEQYIQHHDNTDGSYLAATLAGQKVGRGKLVTTINRKVKEWRKVQAQIVLSEQAYISAYIEHLLTVCGRELGAVLELDDCEHDDPRLEELLRILPIFNPPFDLEQALTDHLFFYKPNLFKRTVGVVRTGILLATLLDTMLWKKPLVQGGATLNDNLVAIVNPISEDCRHQALHAVLGKFSGDFGQIMWCIHHGHLFASEDNNTSAMALLLHRLPSGQTSKWGNIHGLGDGSCVDIILKK